MFTLVIVGRPNVGKSTLFNRLAGRRRALVDDTPGVTRDWRQAQAQLGGLTFTVIDTAGMEECDESFLADRVKTHTMAAMQRADVCLFMVDARAGISHGDRHVAGELRKGGMPILLVANKMESGGDEGFQEARELGLGEPLALSAEHGDGVNEILDALRILHPPEDDADEEPDEESEEESEEESGEESEDQADKPLKIAVMGRPNVGKSTLINRLLGSERLLTGPEAGLTRDSIAVAWEWRGRRIELFDTAGMRRRARVQEKLEKLSVADGLAAIRFAEVVILLMDAKTPFEKQDLHLADLIIREGRGLVAGLNKIDAVPAMSARELREKFDRLLPRARGAPVVGLSALTGEGVGRLMPAVASAHQAWNRRITTGLLNRWLEKTVARHPPPASRGRVIRLRYAVQTSARPPTFAFFCNHPSGLTDAWRRYLENSLREEFDLPGVPIRLRMRKGENPYDP